MAEVILNPVLGDVYPTDGRTIPYKVAESLCAPAKSQTDSKVL